jgi:hypothetical protein
MPIAIWLETFAACLPISTTLAVEVVAPWALAATLLATSSTFFAMAVTFWMPSEVLVASSATLTADCSVW